MNKNFKPNPKLDLVLERTVDVPPSLVWKAWTTPEYLVEWFTPKPWTTTACKIDLRPGGIFATTMRSPEGQEFPNAGCYLEVVKNQKLVWTDAMLESAGKDGCKYTAIAIHSDEASKKTHEQMGFHDGWGTCLDQLVAHMKNVK